MTESLHRLLEIVTVTDGYRTPYHGTIQRSRLTGHKKRAELVMHFQPLLAFAVVGQNPLIGSYQCKHVTLVVRRQDIFQRRGEFIRRCIRGCGKIIGTQIFSHGQLLSLEIP